MWIDVHPDPPFNPSEFQRISEFFGIWHEHRRGNYRGLHEFYWENNYILLLNTHELMNGMRKADIRFNKNSLNSYRSFKPAEVPTIRSNDFDKRILSDIKLANMKLDTFKAKTVGQSCDEVSH